MKKIIFLNLILIYSLRIHGQVFSPPTFENYTPKWSRLSTSSKLPLNIQSYQLKQAWLGPSAFTINDSKMYNVYNIIDEYYNGYTLKP